MLRLFNKAGALVETPPTPARWGDILHSIVRWRDAVYTPTTVYNDLARVQDFVNGQFGQRTDADIYGQTERWAFPSQMLQRGEGDCEDHAIMKWAYLNAMGYSPRLFSIAVVNNRQDNAGHAVLVYMNENENMVLDTLFPHVYPDRTHQWYDPSWALGWGRNWYFPR